MKKINVLFIAMLFLGGFAQAQNSDYSILRTDVVSYFSKYESGSNPKAIRIDQNIPSDSGAFYHSYEMGTFVYWEGEGPTYLQPYASFIGNYALVNDNEDITFNSARNLNLHLKQYGFEGEWTIYNESDGACLKGQYISVDTMQMVGGLIDSCATIGLSVYDSLGNLWEDHYFTNQEIIISKNYGIIKLFKINQFSGLYTNDDFENWPAFYYITGLERDGQQNGYNFGFYETLVKSVEIGTELHYLSEERGTPHGMFENIRVVTDKIIDDSICSYTCELYSRQVNSVNFDSTIINMTYSYKMMPQQTLGKGDTNNWSGVYKIYNYTETTDDSRANLTYNKWNYIGDDTFFDFPSWRIVSNVAGGMGTMGWYKFTYGLGEIIVDNGEDHPGYDVVYYKTPSEEWGTPYDFFSGINDVATVNIKIYPNPAEDRVQLSFNKERVNQLNIINLQGKIVLTKEIQEITNQINLDISKLNNGIYFLELILDENRKYQKKLIVN